MNTPSPDYFRITDTVVPGPQPIIWWKRPVVRRAALITGGVLFLGFLGLFGFNIWQSYRTQSYEAGVRNDLMQGLLRCAEGDEGCKIETQTDVARTSGIADICSGLAYNAEVNCVQLIARDNQSVDTCDVLKGVDREACRDTVLLSRALHGEHVQVCDGILDTRIQLSCRGAVESRARAEHACVSYGIDPAVCDRAEEIRTIVSAGDVAGCADLSGDDRDTCLDIFASQSLQ